MLTEGSAFCYGDNIDTDVIIPARYLNNPNPKVLATHCMEDIDFEFSKKVKSGDVIVAGKNFGCGSSREHAPVAIEASGICCVIATSFARIFYRNALNIGFPIFECAEAVNKIDPNDRLSVELETGKIYNLTKNEQYQAQTFPSFMQNMINKKGLIEITKEKCKEVNHEI